MSLSMGLLVRDDVLLDEVADAVVCAPSEAPSGAPSGAGVVRLRLVC